MTVSEFLKKKKRFENKFAWSCILMVATFWSVVVVFTAPGHIIDRSSGYRCIGECQCREVQPGLFCILASRCRITGSCASRFRCAGVSGKTFAPRLKSQCFKYQRPRRKSVAVFLSPRLFLDERIIFSSPPSPAFLFLFPLLFSADSLSNI